MAEPEVARDFEGHIFFATHRGATLLFGIKNSKKFSRGFGIC